MERSIFEQLSGRPDGCYITYKRIVERDEYDNTPPDQRDDGFWPSLRPEDDGYMGEDATAGALVRATEAAQARMDDWHKGEWYWVGVKARAVIHHKLNRTITTYTLESAGVWGIESDADDSTFNVIFDGEVEQLQSLFESLKTAQPL